MIVTGANWFQFLWSRRTDTGQESFFACAKSKIILSRITQADRICAVGSILVMALKRIVLPEAYGADFIMALLRQRVRSAARARIPGRFQHTCLLEVTLQQALEGLAVTGLVAGHLMRRFAPLQMRLFHRACYRSAVVF